MLICQNAEGYMVRKRLGTPALGHGFSKCSVRSPRAPQAICLLINILEEIYCGAP